MPSKPRRLPALALPVLLAGSLHAQKLPAFELDEAWKEKVAALAPTKAQAKPAKPRKVLVFSLATGFKHWCIPHTEAVVQILGNQSGAYTCVPSTDIEDFRPERLKEFDAVVLNNNCPTGKKRDLFHDVLVQRIGKEGKKYAEMPEKEREKLARELYRSLVDYVAEGGGLVLLHGAIANFAQSDEFSALAGGSFDYHPPQQEVTLIPCCPDHPVTQPFGGKPFVHHDEPYVLAGAYDQFNFKPLLELEREGIKTGKRKGFHDQVRYVAWIKPYKKGRVFFSSPSHNAQSFERPELLGFLLNGMQYAVGDLECEDEVIGK
ncbi:MAG: ThuA domain-containing protein [Akkermansiaceae bacterium]|nr:ThuA domain-containing protein [Akkermansiaceae bacterium]